MGSRESASSQVTTIRSQSITYCGKDEGDDDENPNVTTPHKDGFPTMNYHCPLMVAKLLRC